MGWMVPMIAAAEQKRQDDKVLAELISKDKEDKYEFKILRGYLGTFRNAERLQTILEEERRSRWEMVIKLDDERIILRRPRHSQAYDASSGAEIDPYRTQIGNSRVATKISILLGILVLIGGMVAFMGIYKSDAAVDGASWPPIMIGLVLGIVMVLMVWLKRNR